MEPRNNYLVLKAAGYTLSNPLQAAPTVRGGVPYKPDKCLHLGGGWLVPESLRWSVHMTRRGKSYYCVSIDGRQSFREMNDAALEKVLKKSDKKAWRVLFGGGL